MRREEWAVDVVLAALCTTFNLELLETLVNERTNE